ncbi:MAG: hypothetical protein ACFB0Z_02035 [Candidatus Phaeomarinobacter sp.]
MGSILINLILLLGAAVLYGLGEFWVPIIVAAVAGPMLGMSIVRFFGGQ